MSQRIRNVSIVGATGTTGSVILNALVKSAKFNITVVARKALSSTPPGVTVKVIDFESRDALVQAFESQDAVVDATSVPDASFHLRLVDAAAAAGVFRFLASEYSTSPENEKARAVPIYHSKNEVIDRLKELAADNKITWASISTGAFLDWNLRSGFFKIHLKEKKAQLLYNGAATVPWTFLEDVGQAVVGVLLHPEETNNRPLHVSSVEKSQSEMIALAKEALGKDGWDVIQFDLTRAYQDSLVQLQAGNVTFEVVGNMLLYGNSNPEWASGWSHNDNVLLGVRQWNDEEVKDLIRTIASE